MNFDQFFTEQTTENCTYEHRMMGIIGILTVVCIAFESMMTCARRDEIKFLTRENESLKYMILKSLDKAFVRMMKNGNDPEDEHED